MQKTILSIVMIFFIVNSYNLSSMDVNNNNNNNQCPELPKEIWKNEIVKKFIYPILKAETLPELKSAVKEFLKISLISKKYAEIVRELSNEEFEIDGNKITLKHFFNLRMCKVLSAIREKLDNGIRSWFYNIDSVNLDGVTALMFATCNNQKDMVELLIKNNAKMNIRNKWGTTALIIAVLDGNREMVELLIQKGADINVKNRYGKTALDCAAYIHRYDIVELLERYKKEQELKNNQNNNNESESDYVGKRHECIVQ